MRTVDVVKIKFPELKVSTRLSCCLQLPCVLTAGINTSLSVCVAGCSMAQDPQCSFSFNTNCFWPLTIDFFFSVFFLITSLFGKQSWGMSSPWSQLPTLPCSLGTHLSLLFFHQWPKQCPEGDLPAFSNSSLTVCLSLSAFVVIYSSNLPRSNPKPTAARSKSVVLSLQLNRRTGMMGQGPGPGHGCIRGRFLQVHKDETLQQKQLKGWFRLVWIQIHFPADGSRTWCCAHCLCMCKCFSEPCLLLEGKEEQRVEKRA